MPAPLAAFNLKNPKPSTKSDQTKFKEIKADAPWSSPGAPGDSPSAPWRSWSSLEAS